MQYGSLRGPEDESPPRGDEHEMIGDDHPSTHGALKIDLTGYHQHELVHRIPERSLLPFTQDQLARTCMISRVWDQPPDAGSEGLKNAR
jgi:hypothetical protein